MDGPTQPATVPGLARSGTVLLRAVSAWHVRGLGLGLGFPARGRSRRPAHLRLAAAVGGVGAGAQRRRSDDHLDHRRRGEREVDAANPAPAGRGVLHGVPCEHRRS